MKNNKFGLGARIKDFRIAKNIQQNELALKITAIAKKNITPQYLAKIESEDIENPSYKFATWILLLYPEISANWLLTGNGNMFTIDPNGKDGNDITFVKDFISNKSMVISKNILMNVFYVDTFDHSLLLYKIQDESMKPTFVFDQYIVVKEGNMPQNHDLVLVQIDKEVFVKRYILNPINHTVTLICDNCTYPNIEITEDNYDKLEIIGTVCHLNLIRS